MFVSFSCKLTSSNSFVFWGLNQCWLSLWESNIDTGMGVLQGTVSAIVRDFVCLASFWFMHLTTSCLPRMVLELLGASRLSFHPETQRSRGLLALAPRPRWTTRASHLLPSLTLTFKSIISNKIYLCLLESQVYWKEERQRGRSADSFSEWPQWLEPC